MLKKLLCIVGPTATGKTDLGISLAKKLNGEIIACDSRQVYKGLDIGTGKLPTNKPPLPFDESKGKYLDIGTGKLPGNDVLIERKDRYWIIDGIPVWGYDMVLASSQYDVWQYVKDIKEIIDDVVSRRKLPIIVGGTGLYLKGLLRGFKQMEIPIDLELREELEALSLEEVQNKLKKLNEEYFSSLNTSELHNKRRLIRKIEIELPKDAGKENNAVGGIEVNFDVLKIGLETKREVLYKRIDTRVERRVFAGMIQEAEQLHENGLSFERMRDLGLEYGMLADYLEGPNLTKKEFVERLQFKIHQYAKRQLTWFKADAEIKWFDIMEKDFQEKVEDYVLGWYNTT